MNQTVYMCNREDDGCLFEYKSTQDFQGVFKQFEVQSNILCWLSDGEKERTLPKVSPFIV